MKYKLFLNDQYVVVAYPIHFDTTNIVSNVIYLTEIEQNDQKVLQEILNLIQQGIEATLEHLSNRATQISMETLKSQAN